ncbi:PIN domain-containing protein [Providencia rettgeri]
MSGVRAGDALHLAVAIHHGATIYTLDRKFAEAGENMGAMTKLL